MAELKTDYQDDVLDTSQNTNRVFNIKDSNGNVLYSNVSLEDVTQYTQEGDEYGARQVNEQNQKINEIATGLTNEANTRYDGLINEANARSSVDASLQAQITGIAPVPIVFQTANPNTIRPSNDRSVMIGNYRFVQTTLTITNAYGTNTFIGAMKRASDYAHITTSGRIALISEDGVTKNADVNANSNGFYILNPVQAGTYVMVGILTG